MWCPSVLAVLVHWVKMDAQKTYVLWLNRNTEEQAFSGRGARARQVATHLSAEVRAVLANTDLPTPITVSYGGQHLVQGATHRSSLCRVERIHGTHQNFERIACKRFFALARQSQTYASPVRLEWLSDQVPSRFKRLNGLCRGAAGCRLKFRECRRGPRERVGTREEAERHPLGRTEFAVIALSLYEPSHLQQELGRFARRHDYLFGNIIAFRN